MCTDCVEALRQQEAAKVSTLTTSGRDRQGTDKVNTLTTSGRDTQGTPSHLGNRQLCEPLASLL